MIRETEYIKLEKNDYDIIFRCINDYYTEYCHSWLNKTENKYNLKKKLIRDIYCVDNSIENQLATELQEYMYNYRSGLDDLYFKVLLGGEVATNISKKAKFGGRVKTIESIENKIYRKMNDGNGTFPINKYLNDLLGFRIIDPNYKENINDVKELLEQYELEGFSILHKDRSNKGYEGYHVYFRESNNTFPIEVQIWDMEMEHDNIKMHKVYKQGYLGKIIEDYNKF
ncbi:MAG: hypothetical protein RSD22_06430 [Romboutsia sp.]